MADDFEIGIGSGAILDCNVLQIVLGCSNSVVWEECGVDQRLILRNSIPQKFHAESIESTDRLHASKSCN